MLWKYPAENRPATLPKKTFCDLLYLVVFTISLFCVLKSSSDFKKGTQNDG
jgi:hypothetical protein